ncbi:MAG: glycosyltransferase [Propionibacteriaceae bacterium]
MNAPEVDDVGYARHPPARVRLATDEGVRLDDRSIPGDGEQHPVTSRPYVIMVTHNSASQVGASLDALAGSDVDVHVVDNASVDTSCTVVRQNYPWVVLRSRRDNQGVAVAVNEALRSASIHGVVILVNPDCVVAPGTMGALASYLDDHPAVGIVGPRLVDAAGVTTISAYPFETRLGVGATPLRTRAAGHGGARPRSVDWLSGACLAIRTELLRQIGGLDESCVLYVDDVELCRQAHQRGADVVLLPAVVAQHPGWAGREPGMTGPHLHHSRMTFFARHRPVSLPALRAGLLLRCLPGLAHAAVEVGSGRPGARRRLRARWTTVRIVMDFRPPPPRTTRH